MTAAEESDVPRNLHNIVVSIHAIATFQALHDYLRPRVAGLLSGGSRLSGMLAALAASGFTGSTSRSPPEDVQQRPPPAAPAESSSAAAAAPPSASTLGRRRSQRLSAKIANASDPPIAGPSTSSVEETLGRPGGAVPEAAPSDTVVDSDLRADFSDDEIDAEVFDDEVDPDNSVSEKTVTLSVGEGKAHSLSLIWQVLTVVLLDGSKIEAQTPDGTRVATPSAGLKIGTMATPRESLSTRASYAAALKAKPTDWHLEFFMDEHPLPLDLTIYGAIHQHELRKKTGALPPNLIWQGVYTVKFKKVSGPPPSPDGELVTSSHLVQN